MSLPNKLQYRLAYSPQLPQTPPWNGCLDVDGVRMYAGDGATEGVAELIARGTRLGADTETAGLEVSERCQVKCVTFGHWDTERGGLAVLLDPRRTDHRQLIQQVFAEAPGLIFHNLPFDSIALYEAGIVTDLDWLDRAWDTIVAARLVKRLTANGTGFEKKNSLAELLWQFLGVGADPATKPLQSVAKVHGFTTGKTDKGNHWYKDGDIDVPAYAIGAMSDVVYLPQLLSVLQTSALADMTNADTEYRPSYDQALHVFYREQVVNRCLTRANTRGFEVDEAYCQRYYAEATEKLSATVPALVETGWLIPETAAAADAPLWVKYKPNRKAVINTLLAEGKIDPATYPYTAGGTTLSTSADSLETVTATVDGKQVTDPRIVDWLQFVEVQITSRNYVGKVLSSRAGDGRVRSHAHIMDTATGRMTYKELPLQQFNDPGRRCIVARNWVSIDWTAVEPVTAAALAGDWHYVEQVEGGADPYIPVARAAGLIPEGLPDYPPPELSGREADEFPCARNHAGRKHAKVILLGLMYGKGLAALAEELGMNTDAASRLKWRVTSAIPLIDRKLQQQKDLADEKGYISSASGRLLRVVKNPDGSYRGYTAQNYLCQGSAYDVLAETIYAAEQQGIGHKIHLAIHDELVVDADAQEQFEELMQGAMATLARVSVRANDHKFCTDAHALPTNWKKV